MKRFLLMALMLFIIVNITGCNQKNENLGSENIDPQKTPISKGENVAKQKSPLTKDEYKDTLSKSYEKYIKPLDLNEYDDIENIFAKKDNVKNEDFLNDIEEAINDSKINITAFESIIKDLKIDDSKLQNLNDKLFKECKVLLDDIKVKEEKLSKIDDTVLKKSKTEFKAYLETNLDDDITEVNKFDEVIDEIEKELNIKLED